MFQIQTLNNIDQVGLNQFPNWPVSNRQSNPTTRWDFSPLSHHARNGILPTLKAIARAGAGTNNIPIEKLTRLGIPVFIYPRRQCQCSQRTVIAGMLIASRNLCQAWDYTRKLTGDDPSINQTVEKDKKQFAGFELPGKTLGIIGLGSIGVKVANAAMALGMKVIGYDPSITIKRAWELSSAVEEVYHLDEHTTPFRFYQHSCTSKC